MSRQKETLAFDLSLYGSNVVPAQVLDDMVALGLEHQEAPESERINSYELKFGSDGEPVGFVPRWDTPKDCEENLGMYSMRDLALNGTKYMMWISPASVRYGYPESRIVVGEVNEVSNNGIRIQCRALCLQEDLDYCQAIVTKLGINALSESSIRSQALPIEVDGDLIQTLRELIPKDEIWKAIIRGSDVIQKKDRERMLISVAEMVATRLSNGDDPMVIGRLAEQRMMAMGIRLTSRGDCGRLNSDLGVNMLGKGTFNYVFGLSNPIINFDNGEYFDCPKCKKPIPSGKGIETCPHCGVKKSDYGSNCD